MNHEVPRKTSSAVARRRAEVVSRFASLARPTREEADAAAAELGISRARMHMLAEAWRTHGRLSMRMGALKNDPAARDRAIAAAEGALDLTAFREDARPELERRIRTIARYLRTGSKDRETSHAHAREYGAPYATFRHAVTAWLISPEPTSLPSVKSMRSSGLELKKIHPDVETFIADAIRESGVRATTPDITRKVARRCRAAGLRAPSTGTILDRLLSARVESKSKTADETVCLDRVHVREDAGSTRGCRYTLTLLFGSSSGTVVGHHLDAAGPSARTDAMAIARHLLDARADAVPLPLEMDIPPGSSWDALVATLDKAGADTWIGHDRALRSARLARASLGVLLGRLRYRRIGPATTETGDGIRSVPEAVREMVEQEIRRHNAERPTPTIVIGTRLARDEVADQLDLLFNPSR